MKMEQHTTTKIVVVTQLSLAEFRKANMQMLFRRAWWLLALPIYAIGNLIVMEGPQALVQDPWRQVGAYMWALGILVGLPALTWFVSGKQWSANPAWAEEKTFVFSNDGVEVVSPSIKAEAKWSIVKRARRWGGMLFLFMGGNTSHMIPMRALADEVKKTALCELIRKHIANRDF